MKQKPALLFEGQSFTTLLHHFEKNYNNVNKMKKRKK